MTIESSFVETEFGKFHVESAGQGAPWLFIHGGTALGLDRFGVVGQSFGGFWGLSMALAQPDRLTGLVIVNGAGGPMTDAELAQLANRTAVLWAESKEN